MTSASTTRKVNAGPDHEGGLARARGAPCHRPRAAASSVRTTVVPTATTRPPRRARGGDGLRRLRGDDVGLGLEAVVLDVLHRDRAEGARADVQDDLRDGDAGRAQRVEQSRREMQPRGGRGHAALLARVHRLVAVAVFGRSGRRM